MSFETSNTPCRSCKAHQRSIATHSITSIAASVTDTVIQDCIAPLISLHIYLTSVLNGTCSTMPEEVLAVIQALVSTHVTDGCETASQTLLEIESKYQVRVHT